MNTNNLYCCYYHSRVHSSCSCNTYQPYSSIEYSSTADDAFGNSRDTLYVCFLCGPISSFRFIFFDPKTESTCVCNPNVLNWTRKKMILRIRWPKSSDFGPKSDYFGHQIFKSKNGMVSKINMSSTQHAAAERSISWMAAQQVVSRLTRSRQSARLSGAKIQSAGAGPDLETKRSARGACLSVDTYSYHRLQQLGSSQSAC